MQDKPNAPELTPEPPIKDPQPYKDPIAPQPGDPGEDRPLRDPQPRGRDLPRS